jgi:mutator protein MutT
MTQWNFCPQCAIAMTTDPLGNPTCPDGHYTKYPTPVAATLALIRNNNKYLVLRRADEPQKGFWDLPGGFVEPGETAPQTVAREIAEETGITDIHIVDFLGTFSTKYGDIVDVLTCGYLIETNQKDITLSPENDGYQWLSIDEIDNLAFQDSREAVAILRTKML